jgi:hypothetical protein
LGHPISDGPGWAILQIPVIWLHAYAVEGPVLITVVAWILRRRNVSAAFLYVSVLVLTPAMHLLMIEGSDLPALSATFLLLCLNIYDESSWACIVWTLVCGMVVTARINLIAVPIAIHLLRRDWKSRRAWQQSSGSIMIAIAFHLVFYSMSPAQYAPLYLITRAHLFLAHAVGLSVICTLLCVLLVLRYTAKTAWQMCVFIGFFLLLAHIPLAVGNLLYVHYQFAIWEGYEYISLCLVCLVGGVAATTFIQGDGNISFFLSRRDRTPEEALRRSLILSAKEFRNYLSAIYEQDCPK